MSKFIDFKEVKTELLKKKSADLKSAIIPNDDMGIDNGKFINFMKSVSNENINEYDEEENKKINNITVKLKKRKITWQKTNICFLCQTIFDKAAFNLRHHWLYYFFICLVDYVDLQYVEIVPISKLIVKDVVIYLLQRKKNQINIKKENIGKFQNEILRLTNLEATKTNEIAKLQDEIQKLKEKHKKEMVGVIEILKEDENILAKEKSNLKEVEADLEISKNSMAEIEKRLKILNSEIDSHEQEINSNKLTLEEKNLELESLNERWKELEVEEFVQDVLEEEENKGKKSNKKTEIYKSINSVKNTKRNTKSIRQSIDTRKLTNYEKTQLKEMIKKSMINQKVSFANNECMNKKCIIF